MATEIFELSPEKMQQNQWPAESQEVRQTPTGWRGRLLSLATAATVGLGSMIGVEVINAPEAHAVTITYGDLGYPWAHAPCKFPGDSGGNPHCANPNNSADSYDWGEYDSSGVFHQYRNGAYEYRNCTDYVAWKIESLGGTVSGSLGNGGQWYNNASPAQRSRTPKAGEAAVVPGQLGHVAFVDAVYPDGTIAITEYNEDGKGDGDMRVGTPAALGMTEFVDFGVRMPAEAGASVYSNGEFLYAADTNRMYEMVGGAPIRIYNWGIIPSFRGQAASVTQAQVNALPPYPKDGTFVTLQEAGGNGIYEFIGGAPIRQYNWGILPNFNPSRVMAINAVSLILLDHMRPVPLDGSFVTLQEAGGNGIYEFVGGAPIRQYNWGLLANFNPADVEPVNAESVQLLDHMNAVPADRSFVNIQEANGNGVYEFIGGAPLRLYNWGIVPGFGSTPDINYESLQLLDHMRAVPASGEFVASAETGIVYRIAGGAALRLYNQGGIPGFNGLSTPYVNQKTIDTSDHLSPIPADRTLLEGLPSGTYWQVVAGRPTEVGPQAGAVAVDDQTIQDMLPR